VTASFGGEGGGVTSAEKGGAGLDPAADGDGLSAGALTTSFCEEGRGAGSWDEAGGALGLGAGTDGPGLGALTTSFCDDGASAVVMGGAPDPPPHAPTNALDTSRPTSAFRRIGQTRRDIGANIDKPLDVPECFGGGVGAVYAWSWIGSFLVDIDGTTQSGSNRGIGVGPTAKRFNERTNVVPSVHLFNE